MRTASFWWVIKVPYHKLSVSLSFADWARNSLYYLSIWIINGLRDGYGCTYSVFKFLVVKLDVRSMNEVTLLHYIYFIFLLSYYNHKNSAKCDDISVILEFSVICICDKKKNNCIDFNCTVEDIIVVNRSCLKCLKTISANTCT